MISKFKQINGLFKRQIEDTRGVDEGTVPFGHLVEEYHDPKVARNAIRFSVVAVLAFFVWAALSPVHELATGTGVILPSGFVQNVHHLEGGIVDEIVVQEGQTIRKHQPLVILDDTNTRAELIKAKARAEGARLSIDRLTTSSVPQAAPQDGELKLRGISDSQHTASLVDDQYRDAQLKVIRAEIQLKKSELTALSPQLAKAKEEQSILAAQLSDYEDALKSGAISRRERDTVARELLQIDARIETITGQQTATRAQILAAQAREDELTARFVKEAASEVAELEIQRVEQLELVTQLADRLSRTVIRAPEDGVVHNLAVRNQGQVVAPGDLVVELVPASRDIFAEVEVPAEKIGFVTAGATASVKILTYDYSRFGSVEGEIYDISPSSFTHQDGQRFYRVRIKLESDFVGDMAGDKEILPGMSVTADIKLGQKTVLSYLLKPLRALSDRALTEQ